MTNSYNIQLHKKHFFPSLEEKLLQRQHLYFNGDNTVSDKSICPSTAKRLIEKDFGIHKPLNKNDSFLIVAKSHIRRKHFYFNEDSTITDKSPTPSTAEKLFRQDLGLPILTYNRCAYQEYNGKGKHLSFNEEGQTSRGKSSQSSIIKMSWTDSEICLPYYDVQLTKKHLFCTSGKNCIQRKHLCFNEDGTTTDKSPHTSTALKLFEDDMKRSNLKLRRSTHPNKNIQGRHFWFDTDGKIIDKSSYPTTIITPNTVIQNDFTSICQNVGNVSPQCPSLNVHQGFDSNITDISDGLPNEQITNAKNLVKSSFSDLSRDDSEALEQFTSLKIKEKDRESNTDEKSLAILQLKPDLQVPNEANLEFVNEPASMQGHFDNCLLHYKEDNFCSFHKESKITNPLSSSELLTAQDHQNIFPDDQESPRSDQHKTKDLKTEHSSDFLKLTFGRDSNKYEVVLEEEKKCPIVSCQMYVKLPHKHFKQYHHKLPKWKKNTCLTLFYLNSAQDKTFQSNRCLFCNSMEVSIKHHLCHAHHLPSNTKLYEEMLNRCPTVFLNNTELLIETVLNAFKSYQRSKGLKEKDVSKQVLLIQDVLSSLSDDCRPDKWFIGRLLASNMYSIINILFVQKQSFNKLLHKQLMIFRNFLEFLHFNSDIFSPVDKDWWEQVLPSWNVLELNENQLNLVTCKI